MNFIKLKPYDKKPDALNVVVETPRGSRNKFKFDADKQIFMIKRVLPQGMVFPFDFGFLPSTIAEDGDPLDVMVLTDAPAAMGAMVIARPIGAIEAIQTEKRKTVRNDRVVAVSQESVEFADVKSIEDMSARVLREFELFFVNYHGIQGRRFKVLRVRGPRQARSLIEKSIQKAKEK